MSQNQDKGILDIYLHEYDKVKEEQIQRIGFRDNMIYVNLVAVGAVASFGISSQDRLFVFLLIPWVCTVLGWTSLVNDEKITALGRYVRLELEERIRKNAGTREGELFGWEVAHRSDPHRLNRKKLQLFVDLLTFCFSGIAALVYFLLQIPNHPPVIIGVAMIELMVLFALGYQIVIYADLKKGR